MTKGASAGQRGASGAHLAATAIACVLWGGSVVGTKLSFDLLPPMALGLVRFSLATVCFFVLLAARRQLHLPRGREAALMALTGILGTTLYFAGENLGCMLLSASTSALVVGSFPAMTVVLECLAFRRRPSARMVAGISLAFAGVGVLSFFEARDAGGDEMLGLAVLLGSGACWALYNVLMQRFEPGTSILAITGWQTLFGTLGFVPLALIEGGGWREPAPSALLSLAYLVFGCTLAAFTLYNYGLAGLSPSVAASLVNLVPVIGLLAGALVLGETISIGQVVGCAAIVGGIFLSSAPRRDAA